MGQSFKCDFWYSTKRFSVLMPTVFGYERLQRNQTFGQQTGLQTIQTLSRTKTCGSSYCKPYLWLNDSFTVSCNTCRLNTRNVNRVPTQNEREGNQNWEWSSGTWNLLRHTRPDCLNFTDMHCHLYSQFDSSADISSLIAQWPSLTPMMNRDTSWKFHDRQGKDNTPI